MPFDLSFLEGHGGSIAGLIGAAVSSALKPANTITGAILHLLSGALCAHYLGGPVIAYFQLSEPYHGATFFLIGVFGLAILLGIMRALEKYDFGRFFPKGGKR